MKNWQELGARESKFVWDFIYDKLSFNPYGKNNERIILPAQHIWFDISAFYEDGFKQELYDEFHYTVNEWFNHVSKEKRVYALSWQHECYSFSPELPFEKDDFGEWLIPVYPNGDYSFFLTKDFRNGIFADGINFLIALFGAELIGALETSEPRILTNSRVNR